MHDNANLLIRPVQLGLPFIARIFHGPLYNSEGKSLSCAVPEHQRPSPRCPPPTFRRIFHTTMKTRNVGKRFVTRSDGITGIIRRIRKLEFRG